jgi:hypothetical protein
MSARAKDVTNAAATGSAPGVFAPKIKRHVTLPTLSKLKDGQTIYIRFDSVMTISKVVKPVLKPGDKPEEPATIAQVTMLDTGELYTFLVPAVVKSVLNEEYPKDAYLGKGFAIQQVGQKDGKRYKNYTVAELEL